jgi:uncharacterized repeat protein (TIGR01451 family)
MMEVDMMTGELSVRRLMPALLAGVLALLLTVGLSLLFSRSQSLAWPAAELEIQKMVNTTQAGPGDTLTYTIHAWNAGGQPIYGAWLTDTLANELDEVTSLTATYGDFGFANRVITWTGDLGSIWITFSVKISPEIAYATITNTAQVVSGTVELVVSDPVTTEVTPGKLEAYKSVSPSTGRPGEELVYTVYISNTGGGTVAAAEMTDDLPLVVSYTTGLTATTGNVGVVGNSITWTGSLDALEMAAVTFATVISPTLSEGTLFTNTAEITGAGSLVQAEVRATAVTTFTYRFPLIYHNCPPSIVLYSIPTPVDGAYTVRWQNLPGVDYYRLQESTSSKFSSIRKQWLLTSHSKYINQGSALDEFYYRVRVESSPCGLGPWSNVKSAETGFYDNFSNYNSGWPDKSGTMYDDRKWKIGYKSWEYRIKIEQGGPEAWFYQPLAEAPYRPPTNKFCVETDAEFKDGAYWANMGLVFGYDDDEKFWALCLGRDDSSGLGPFIAYKNDYDFPHRGCSGPTKKWEISDRDGTSREGWNHLEVAVNGDTAKVWIGNDYKGSWTFGSLGGKRRVGLIGGVYEATPVDIRFDNFKVKVNSNCN